MAAPRKYPVELMERAVNEVLTSGRPIAHVADLGIHREALRKQVRQAQADRAPAASRVLPSDVNEELKALRRENGRVSAGSVSAREPRAQPQLVVPARTSGRDCSAAAMARSKRASSSSARRCPFRTRNSSVSVSGGGAGDGVGPGAPRNRSSSPVTSARSSTERARAGESGRPLAGLGPVPRTARGPAGARRAARHRWQGTVAGCAESRARYG
jgi:transposase